MDTRKYYVLGESTEKQVDVRIIAATNRNLKEAVENKIFREDLYYRLNVLQIEILPLRQRKDDITHLVQEHRILLRGKETGPGFREVMTAYPWPGNVRELLNILKRAGIMLEIPITGDKMTALLDSDSRKSPVPGVTAGKQKNDNRLPVDTREKIAAGASFWDVIWDPFIDRELDRNTVKSILKDFYSENSHSFKKLTRYLNVAEKDYKKFMSLLYKYKIDPRK
jgi:DNA-binding NtrC family response regulator